MAVGKLGVPALAGHALRSDVHGASVIRALPLETGRRHVDLRVLVPPVRVWVGGRGGGNGGRHQIGFRRMRKGERVNERRREGERGGRY